MELRQLQYVIKIAECGTMLKAAQELYISQSGLTRSLKTLEKELGMELFDRINNPARTKPAAMGYGFKLAILLLILESKAARD